MHVHGSSVVGLERRRHELAKLPAGEREEEARWIEREADCFAAMQIESAFTGHRDSEANVELFAQALARALVQFIRLHNMGQKEGKL